jgi:hypothetical protein
MTSLDEKVNPWWGVMKAACSDMKVKKEGRFEGG